MRRDANIPRKTVIDERFPSVISMNFDLIAGYGDTSLRHEIVDQQKRIVRHADRTTFALIDEGFHGPPRIDEGSTAQLRGPPARFVESGVLPRHGEMDEVEVEVVQAKIAEAVIARLGDDVDVVIAVP